MKLTNSTVILANLLNVQAAVLPSNQSGNPSSTNLDANLGYGTFRGFHNATTDLNIWRGIRYAAPPTGSYRWTGPRPPKVERGVTQNATAFGPICPQSYPGNTNPPPGNEDCLYLNVYAPSKACTTNKLPVLVWIHGGGYGAGDGRQDMSEIINANENGFVAVAIQYRLGAFGFLSSADVASSGVVNAGILDMEFALKWVQKHIGTFGGDKRKITISGESAGGGAVMLLGIARSGKLENSLFQNGIAASPYLPAQYDFDSDIPTQRYRQFAARAGCNDTDHLSCLRGKDSALLQQVNADVTAAGTSGTWAFNPVTDRNFITTTPSKALTAKQVNGKHMLIGNNANEGAPFVPANITTESDLRVWLGLEFPTFADADIQQLLNAYPTDPNVDPNLKFATNGISAPTAVDVSQVATGQQQRANNIFAEATFICPSYWINDAYTGNGRSSYHYQYSIPFASHGEDVPAYFGPATPNQPPEFTSVFRRIWGDFIKNERNASERVEPVEWQSGKGAQLLNLNTTGGEPYEATTSFGAKVVQFQGPGVKSDIGVFNAWSWEGGRGERCEFWRGIASKVPI